MIAILRCRGFEVNFQVNFSLIVAISIIIFAVRFFSNTWGWASGIGAWNGKLNVSCRKIKKLHKKISFSSAGREEIKSQEKGKNSSFILLTDVLYQLKELCLYKNFLKTIYVMVNHLWKWWRVRTLHFTRHEWGDIFEECIKMMIPFIAEYDDPFLL
jgi:hypothetical protein